MKKDCCSIPRYGVERLETLKKWSELMNPACCLHDDLYGQGWGYLNGVLIEVKNRKEADEIFYNQMLKIAHEHEDRYGVLGYHAAKDMYSAVRRHGWIAWKKNTVRRFFS